MKILIPKFEILNKSKILMSNAPNLRSISLDIWSFEFSNYLGFRDLNLGFATERSY